MRSRIEFSPENHDSPLSGFTLLDGAGVGVSSVRSVSWTVMVGDGVTEVGSGKMIGAIVGVGVSEAVLSCWAGALSSDPVSDDVGVGVLEAGFVGTGKTITVDVGLGNDVGKAETGTTTGVA